MVTSFLTANLCDLTAKVNWLLAQVAKPNSFRKYSCAILVLMYQEMFYDHYQLKIY